MQRHGGDFPLDKWLAVEFGSQRHGPRTEVWEKIRSAHRTTSSTSDDDPREIVDAIEVYVTLVQTK